MIARPVVFHPDVEDDLAEIYHHYSALDPALPGRFESAVAKQIERLIMWPESGAVLFEGYRRLLVERFPYMTVYIVRDDRIEVLAVLATRRNPTSVHDSIRERRGV